jgi:PleD family two-component response regulator
MFPKTARGQISLEVSKCFPVCPRKRTFDLRVNDYTSRGHPAARTELILTVDDNPTVLATTVLQLEALGYQTLAAHNAETALEMLETRKSMCCSLTSSCPVR